MSYAIEVLQFELARLKRLIRIVENNQMEIMQNISHEREEKEVADLQQAIAHLQGSGTQPTVDNSVSMAIAQLATDFIASHDLTDIQSITMRNFIDWVALQHT